MNPTTFVLFIVFGIGTILDWVFATLGMAIILQPQNLFGYALTVAGPLAEVGIRLCSPMIPDQRGIYSWLRLACLACCAIDFVAVGISIVAYILLKSTFPVNAIFDWQRVSSEPIIPKLFNFILLLYLTFSPLSISHLFKKYMDDEFSNEVRESSQSQAQTAKRESH